MSVDGQQQRIHARYDGTGFHFLLELDADLLPVEAASTALLNISAGGCGLYQAEGLELGQVRGLAFWRRGAFHTRLATVIHSKVEPSGWTRIGMRFDPAPPGLLASYVDFVTANFGFAAGSRKAG